MALRIDASGDQLKRTAAVPSTSAFTAIGFSRVVAAPAGGALGCVFALGDASNNTLVYWDWDDSGGAVSEFGSYNGATFSAVNPASRPAVGSDFVWCISCSGTGANLLKLQWRLLTSTTWVTATATLQTGTATTLWVGNDPAAEWLSSRHTSLKVYDAALTTAEMDQEAAVLRPVRATNLHGWWPMLADVAANGLIDYSGNGKTLTSAGTITVEDGAPVPYGAPSVINFSSAGPNAYTLTCAAGSYALTGQAAGLRVARSLTAAQGSYSLTGQAAGLLKGQRLTAVAGSYVLSGQAAALRATRALAAAVGSFSLTGQAANLRKGGNTIMQADQGAYTLTGQAAALRVARRLAAVTGTFTLTGKAAALLRVRNLVAAAGSYVLTGKAAAFKATRRLAAATGLFTLTGKAATFVVGRIGLKGRTIAQTVTLDGVATTSTTLSGLTGATRSTSLP